MVESDINPAAVFSLLVLFFVTLTLMRHVFFIFSVLSLAMGGLLGYCFLRYFEEFPNLLMLLQVTGTIKGRKNFSIDLKSKSCNICTKKGCSRHKPEIPDLKNPWENLHVPKSVDDALTEFFEIVLSTHVYSWYRDLSHDQGFVDEVRIAIRQATSVILRRMQRIDASDFIIKRCFKKFMIHLDIFFSAKDRITHKEDDMQQSVLEHMKTYKHFCVDGSLAEEEYLRYTIQTLLPYILPESSLKCKGLNYFLEELLDCVLLQPLIEKIVEPDFVNNLLLIYLDENTIPEPNYPPSEKVIFLQKFGENRAKHSYTSLKLHIFELMHDPAYLYPFMQFMIREGALNILQFCLAVEEFNKCILAVESTDCEEAQITEKIKEINELYFKSDAVDKITFPIDIITDFEKGMSSQQYASSLFQAYEYAVDILEKTYLPLFHQSDEVFILKCGDRIPKAKKSKENNLAKRKFMPFAELSKITNKIKANKANKQLARGEKLTLMDEMDFVPEEAYESYEDDYEQDDDFDDDVRCNGDDDFDMNYCHITIPKIEYVLLKDKKCYVFILKVEKIGRDGSSWEVIRKYNEFYVLDSKLRRFHDVLDDAELPPKRTILKKDFEYLSSIRLKLQEYLQRLVRSPVLKRSSLLHGFLTSGTEIDGMFEPDSVGREAGRKVKSLKSKLIIEKGQNLEVFLNSYLSSAEPAIKKKIPSRPPLNHMFSTHRRHNSMSRLPPPGWARELRKNLSCESNNSVFSPDTFTELVFYACRNFLKIPAWLHHLLITSHFIFKSTINVFIDRYIVHKMSLVTAELQVVTYIRLIRDVIFFDNDLPRTDSDKLARRDKTLRQLLNLFPKGLRNIIGIDNHDRALRNVFEMFQYPKLNKQLFYILFDELLYELFPELKAPGNEEV